jgi:hypothetical protein
VSLRQVQSIPQFAKDGKVKSFLAEPPDNGADPLVGLKFQAGPAGGVPKEAFKARYAPGSTAFTKLKTGYADTLDLSPDEMVAVT